MKQILRLLLVGLIVAFPLISRPVHAASASLTLSPSSSSISNGSTLSVSVRINASEAVNGVQANLSYPTNLLDFVSISSSSAFSIVAQNSGGSGSVKIGRGALPAVSGSQLVATVRFKAKASSGTASVTIASGSQVVSASSNKNIMTSSSGGSYSLRPPAPPPPPPPAADKTPPTIKSVAVSDEKINSATISWVTSEPATSEVSYGVNNGYGLESISSKMVTNHKVVLKSALLTPGTEYHFRVKSVDPAGNAASSADATFRTKGANLVITILDKNGQPVKGAKVTLGEFTGTTDENGQVVLEGFPPGKVVGTVEYNGNKTVINTEITTIDPEGELVPLSFEIDAKGINPLLILVPIIGLLAAAAVLARRNWVDISRHFGNIIPGRGKKPPGGGPTPPSSSSGPQPPEPTVIRPSGTGG